MIEVTDSIFIFRCGISWFIFNKRLKDNYNINHYVFIIKTYGFNNMIIIRIQLNLGIFRRIEIFRHYSGIYRNIQDTGIFRN